MEDQILKGLRELSKTAFPRKCSTCSRVFYFFGEFINETNQLDWIKIAHIASTELVAV